MKSLTDIARRIYRAMPDNALRRRCSAWWFRRAAGGALRRCEWRDGVFFVETSSGVVVRSVREFDPEPLITNMPRLPLRPGGVVLDLGGNIGVTALYAAACVDGERGGRVVVFEPDSENLTVLRENLDLNPAGRCVTVIPKGVSDRSGRMTFQMGGNYTSSLVRTNYIEADEPAYRTVEVDVTTVDDACAELGLPRVDAVKMDIEGSEVAALRGARQTLQTHHPFLVIETHTVEGRATMEEVVKELRQAGYANIQLGEGPTPMVMAQA
ncbi:MAG: FkbM family methyltransferase [Kiritimatiellae bacterium]|nr:FkbM family methyltransferase [Kiritimatiellia bacterium]